MTVPTLQMIRMRLHTSFFWIAQHENSGLGTLCVPPCHTAHLLALEMLSENPAFLSTQVPKPRVLCLVTLCTYENAF